MLKVNLASESVNTKTSIKYECVSISTCVIGKEIEV
jgi:hypothetical protein